MSTLSLYQIDADLEQLIEVRAEMLAAVPPEDTTSVDRHIAAYLTDKLPRKIDGIAAMLRKWKAEAEQARQESRRCQSVAQHLEARVADLKANVTTVMQHCPAVHVSKSGSLSLTGAYSTLRVQGNGGTQEPEIYDESLVPDAFRIANMRLTREMFIIANSGAGIWDYLSVTWEIDTDAIRAELSKPCVPCTAPNGLSDDYCPTCGGTSYHLVPGARLLPRGVSLRVVDR